MRLRNAVRAMWSVAMWWRAVYQPWWTPVGPKPCRWPDCLSQEAADRLCAEIFRELLGEHIPDGEKDLTDYRIGCGCVESPSDDGPPWEG